MNETKPTKPTLTAIRPLTEQDAEAFHAMRLYATRNNPAGIVPTYEEESKRTPEESRARVRATENQVVFGAFVDDTLVGITGLMREPRRKLAHKGLIWGVFVDPAWRGAGIARQLMEGVIAHARALGLLQVQLVVSVLNPRAQAFYRSCGFVRYGVEPRGLYLDGEYADDELMVLFLDDPAVPD
ncbi:MULTISPECIES: GNAT family N-acetyltransferase [Paraburkholderia]|uniref:GNAT family N-acetyltransferase n=1 Tax=Paraburkholderia TaxID=1822464 RepID=UPI000841D897|nr:GNAT family N-acetyltransferase [Paraburkholderia nodosa]